MEEQIETKTYTEDIISYICSDGMKFYNQRQAQQHEDSLIPPRKIPNDYINLHTLDYTWGGATCWFIKEEADIVYLQAAQWNHNAAVHYDGPGWYIAICNDGGDYDDSYQVVSAKEYIQILENDIDILKNLTNS
jgi:hypothetical protein